MLLEEVILALLGAAGYRTVNEVADDPTLAVSAAGMNVIGRGAMHQIDAIADQVIGYPFSNPQRLLVEAKAYSENKVVGLPVIRGMVGILKDVSEYWVSRTGTSPASRRYHYQGAVFSASRFSLPAQQYAFAHDIFLMPLSGSEYFSPLIGAIERVVDAVSHDDNIANPNFSSLRTKVRSLLQGDTDMPLERLGAGDSLQSLVVTLGRVRGALVAMIGGVFPVFLVPRPGLNLADLPAVQDVEIHYSHRAQVQGWNFSVPNGDTLFTFDLPGDLFQLYATEGKLSRRRAAQLKQEVFAETSAIYLSNGNVRALTLRLSHEWIEQLQREIDLRRV